MPRPSQREQWEGPRMSSTRCLLTAMQLFRALETMSNSVHIPLSGLLGHDLDRELRMWRELPLPAYGLVNGEADYLTPDGYGATVLIEANLMAGAVEWWAKAQNTTQQPGKFLEKRMFKIAEEWQYFMDKRNNQLSHFPGLYDQGDKAVLAPDPYSPMTHEEMDRFRAILMESFDLCGIRVLMLDSDINVRSQIQA